MIRFKQNVEEKKNTNIFTCRPLPLHVYMHNYSVISYVLLQTVILYAAFYLNPIPEQPTNYKSERKINHKKPK